MLACLTAGCSRASPKPFSMDADAVVGLFNAIDRVADATGFPFEAEKAQASADFRAGLGLDRFAVGARS